MWVGWLFVNHANYPISQLLLPKHIALSVKSTIMSDGHVTLLERNEPCQYHCCQTKNAVEDNSKYTHWQQRKNEAKDQRQNP